MIAVVKPASATLGARAEKMLEQIYHQLALNRGVARMMKMPTPTRHTGEGGLLFAQVSISDYVGFTLDGSCRHIAEECKYTSQTRFPLAAVKVHQADYLESVWRAGGRAQVTLFNAGFQIHVIPWNVFRDLRSRVKSVTWDDMRPFLVGPASYVHALVQ